VLLSATYSIETDALVLDDFTQVSDENLAIRENGANYEFVLSEGMWVGNSLPGVSGGGTSILSVDKASVAGLAGGIVINTSIISTQLRADTALGAADFSSLTGGLHVTTAAATQSDGESLTVSALDVHAITVDIRGDIVGDAGNILLDARGTATFAGAAISTTSGEIRLNGNVSAATGAFDGLRLRETSITSDTGFVWLSGRSGSNASNGQQFAGVRLLAGSDLDPASTLTTIVARAVHIEGTGVSGASGVAISGTSIEANGMSIRGEGRNGVVINQFSSISSTGTDLPGDAIQIFGEGTDPSSGTGVIIAQAVIDPVAGPQPNGPTIRAIGGDIRILSIDTPARQVAGVEIYFATIETTGTGANAGDIIIHGVGRYSGVNVFGGSTSPVSVRTIDGDVSITGASTASFPELGIDGVGVRLNGQIRTTGSGSVTIYGQAADGDTSVEIGRRPTEGYPTAGGGIFTSAGDVAILFDDLVIGTAGRIVAPSHTVKLFNRFSGGLFILGSTEDYGLSDAELDRIQANVLQIGRNTGGDMIIEGAISQPETGAYGTLVINAGVISQHRTDGSPLPPGRFEVDRLVVRAETVTLPNASIGSLTADVTLHLHLTNDGDLTIGNLSAGSIFIDVTGTVTIAPGATLNTLRFKFSETVFSPDPPAMPQAQIPFLIQNDGSDPIVGTFAGLPEGTQIANVGGRPVRITYQANKPDGMNDAVIELHVEPFARDDAYTISEDIGTLFENLLTNDIDFGNGPLTVTAVNGVAGATGKNLTLPSGANLWVDPDGFFYYTPGDAFEYLAADEEATDTFTYEVTDAYGGTWTARVRITITGEGTADLIGFNGGGWYVAGSDGDSFTTSAWTGWADAEWDALRQGDFNGDGRADVLGLLDGMWFVGISTGSSFTTSLWSQWANVAWQDVLVADLDRDGNDDILARFGGSWWVALSDGSQFLAPTVWASWANLPWDYFAIGTASSAAFAPGTPTLFGFIDGEWWAAQVATSNDGFVGAAKWATLPNADYDAIKLLDYDGDNGSDFAVLLNGTWTIGTQSSYWGPFDDLQTVQWADTDWQDVRIGDFDGDGRDDLLARAGGAWWVMRFDNGTFVTTRWDLWSNLDWQDVTVGDYDGDGTDDLAGRYAGAWWVGTSTGSSFYTTLWDRWTEGGWDAVLAGDVNGVPAAVPSGATGTSGTTTGGTTTIGGFWTSDIINPIDLNLVFPAGEVTFEIDGQAGDESDLEICEDYPYLDDEVAPVASADDTTEPEICLDYPFLDDDPLFDELLMTA